jgi:hypothetical protein
MMHRSEEIGELAKALAMAQGEFMAVHKTQENPYFKSKYASLADVVNAGAPILARHGLSISQHPGFDEHGHILVTWLMHSSGQFLTSMMRLRPTKDDPQGLGSALTYGRRQAYMGISGLVADEDDDGNAASVRQQQARPPQPQAKPPEPTRAPANASQKGMLNGRAAERSLSAQDFANAMRSLSDLEPKQWESSEAAQRFVHAQLERLPADRVDDLLAAIETVG